MSATSVSTLSIPRRVLATLAEVTRPKEMTYAELKKASKDFKGPKPDYVVVTGQTKWGDCYFDLVPGGKKGTEVPAGSYYLISGRVSKGKREHAVHLVIDGAAFLVGRDLRQGRVPENAAFEVFHDVEHGADNAVVVAQGVGLGDRHIGIGQSADDAKFAVDRVRGLQ